MAGNCVLVNDYEPNAETVGDAGVYFSGREGVPDLTRQLERLLDQPDVVDGYRGKARERAALYSWDAVAVRVRAAAAGRVGVQRPRAAADGAPGRAGARHRPGRRLLARGRLGLLPLLPLACWAWSTCCAAASSCCWRVSSAWAALQLRLDPDGRRVDGGRRLQRLAAPGRQARGRPARTGPGGSTSRGCGGARPRPARARGRRSTSWPPSDSAVARAYSGSGRVGVDVPGAVGLLAARPRSGPRSASAIASSVADWLRSGCHTAHAHSTAVTTTPAARIRRSGSRPRRARRLGAARPRRPVPAVRGRPRSRRRPAPRRWARG